MASTFLLDGAEFRVVPMDSRIQLLMLKRLARFLPAVTSSLELLTRLRAGEADVLTESLGVLGGLGPLASSMPDEDLEYVVDGCLDITRQVVNGRAIPVRDPQTGAVTNRDNNAIVRKLGIVGNVLWIVFGPMLPQFPTKAGDADENQVTS